MNRKIIITADGSTTIQIEDWQEQYHSTHGAVQESQHVFIENGLVHQVQLNTNSPLSILEYGFGTGLNAILTWLKSKELGVDINYTGLEAYPVAENELVQLNYHDHLNVPFEDFIRFHRSSWDHQEEIAPNFILRKLKMPFKQFESHSYFDIVYYDAFGARVQPELWMKDTFERIYNLLRPGGIMVTYSSKGSVRRDLESIGFKVERLKGPPGKRHMLRVTK